MRVRARVLCACVHMCVCVHACVCFSGACLFRDGDRDRDASSLLYSRRGWCPLKETLFIFLLYLLWSPETPGWCPVTQQAEVQMLIDRQTAALWFAFQIRLQNPIVNCFSSCPFPRICSFSFPNTDPCNNSLSRDSRFQLAVSVGKNYNKTLQRFFLQKCQCSSPFKSLVALKGNECFKHAFQA